MNRAIIYFRFNQLWKIIREIPIVYLLVILGLLAFGAVYLFGMMQNIQRGSIVAGVWILFLLGLHAGRKDYQFIHLIEESPWQIFCIEYLLLSIPLILMEIMCGYFWPALGMILGCLIISFKKQGFRQVKNGLAVPRFIPVEAFEFRSGFRRLGVVFVVMYIAALATVWLSYVPLVFVWFILFVMADAFKISEPLSILCVWELPPKKFLQKKICLNVSLSSITFLPVYLIYSAFHPEDWLFVVIFFLYGILNTILIVVIKYAYYSPGQKVVAGQIALIISMFGMAFPILFPVTLFYIIKYSLAAGRNLRTYLYVYDSEPACQLS